ncbi:MAG: hypothetical protein F6K54_00230 [Okeania sp. SIO3B5]|uniref:hypothetical protein n=1 Tax=Okeania sp. SIO3B5 TaxID=2607811 RepID=UPI0014006378|nr:hypothetical protein [Okeania sp. SIO3B5]NEO51662.1 hypothetical protein [Okeania sp. SIO3B5]
MGKPINFVVLPISVLVLNKAAGLAVSVCRATVRPERSSAFEAGALEAENPSPRGLGIPRCRAIRNVGEKSR